MNNTSNGNYDQDKEKTYHNWKEREGYYREAQNEKKGSTDNRNYSYDPNYSQYRYNNNQNRNINTNNQSGDESLPGIISFILGLVSYIVPFLGLLISIIGLVLAIVSYNKKGNGWALAGLFLNGIRIVIGIFGFAILAFIIDLFSGMFS